MSPRRTAALRARPEVATSEAPAPAPAPVPDPILDPGPAPSSTRRPSSSGVWIGLAVLVAGLVLIALGWGLVASELQLHDQIAPLVVAGIGGLAVVVIGLAVVNAAVASREEDELRRQLAALTEVLAELGSEGAR